MSRPGRVLELAELELEVGDLVVFALCVDGGRPRGAAPVTCPARLPRLQPHDLQQRNHPWISLFSLFNMADWQYACKDTDFTGRHSDNMSTQLRGKQKKKKNETNQWTLLSNIYSWIIFKNIKENVKFIRMMIGKEKEITLLIRSGPVPFNFSRPLTS